MILQNVQFPRTDICSRERMFFRPGQGTIVKGSDSTIVFQRGSNVDTNTYFNSFSIGKWLKYTRIDNLSINIDFKGSFWVTLYHLYVDNDKVIYKALNEVQIDSDERDVRTIAFDTLPDYGILHFKLTALQDDCEYYGGYYSTENSFEPKDVKIAVGICTFKREEDVTHNIGRFNSALMQNPDSPLYGNLEIFISDNAQTLDIDALSSETVHIFPNKNAGGSGGFTRTIIEALNSGKEFTHMLLMDDDILINPDALVRTYTFLSCIKPEYSNVFIGGHMLNRERQYLQSEAADYFYKVVHRPIKARYVLENDRDIAENEIEEPINHFAWWFCCMPMEVISDTNLPMPFFIKRDDIEYGLRNGRQFVTLNGINVWHEPFEKKENVHLQYYYFRNLLIMDSIHRQSLTKDDVKAELKRVVFEKFAWQYKYRGAEFAMMGVQDYLKGIDYFKSLEPEGLNEALMKLNYKKQPLEDFDWTFRYREYSNNFKYEESKLKEIVRKATFNGWLLPRKDDITVPSFIPNSGLFFRTNRALNYEDSSKTAYVTQRDYKSLAVITKMYYETIRLIDKKYDEVTTEFRDRIGELTNIDFWNEYLARGKEEYHFESRLNEKVRPDNTKAQRDELLESYATQAAQMAAVTSPLINNRIMLQVCRRKGFTCNPKYILKELVAEFGDELEYIWVTDHPSSCTPSDEYPVKVVEADSDEHKKLFAQSKVFITNDMVPAWAAHRPGQIWINTWHAAGPTKHVGFDYIVTKSTFGEKIFELKNRSADYYLAANDVSAKDFAEAFRLDIKRFIKTGTPRNDIFFGDREDLKKEVRAKIGVGEDTRLLIYAPTFRDGWKSDDFGMDYERLKAALSRRFGGEWEILFRNHGIITNKKPVDGAIDVTDYEDMNELLLVSDVLISDYSSCIHDFAVQKKPCFLYATDIQDYLDKERGFIIPIEEWPFDIAADNDELEAVVENFDEDAYTKRLDAFYEGIGFMEDGNASKRVVDLIRKAIGK